MNKARVAEAARGIFQFELSICNSPRRMRGFIESIAERNLGEFVRDYKRIDVG